MVKLIELPYDPAVPLLDRKDENLIGKDSGTPLVTAALFTKARTGEQSKGLSTDEWLEKS